MVIEKGIEMKIVSGIKLWRSSNSITYLCKTVSRIPRQHSGWQSVRFDGNRYVLRGGIRTDFFISLNNPILGKDQH